MEFKTERLILREFAKDDKHNLYKLFKEEFVSMYEAHLPKNISGIEDYIKFHVENAESSDRTHYYFVIELQSTRDFIGIIGYSFVEKMNRKLSEVGEKKAASSKKVRATLDNFIVRNRGE
jgi:RimJ/RimL family protein N-acetyltransferase